MSTAEIGLWILLGLAALTVILLVALLMRRPPPDRHAELLATLADGTERSERALRQEVADSARSTRQELGQNFASFQAALIQQGAEATRTQNAQIDAFAQQLTLMQKTLADTLSTQLQGLS